jgi:hypothetical protein
VIVIVVIVIVTIFIFIFIFFIFFYVLNVGRMTTLQYWKRSLMRLRSKGG